jgi:DNA primase
MSNYSNDDRWSNFKDKLLHLKDSIDPHYLLESLGIKSTHETNKEFRSTCPIHGGDNSTAFRFNNETKTWVCFTRKCHDIYGNDIIGLIKAITGKDFVDAVEHLRELTGDVSEVDYIESKRNREINEFIKTNSSVKFRHKAVNQEYLDRFKSLRSDFFNKFGFKNSTLDYFEVGGGWQDKHGIIRDVIPIRDVDNDLVAYSLRDIRQDSIDDDFKYILTPGFDKLNCLYNLNNAKRYGNKLPIIVVEGFKSVWRLYEYGIKNVVATMGSSITLGHQMLLCTYALKGIVTMFDNDIAGVEATIKAYKDLNEKIDVKVVYIQEVDEKMNGLDPADLTSDQVYSYLRTYFIKEET